MPDYPNFIEQKNQHFKYGIGKKESKLHVSVVKVEEKDALWKSSVISEDFPLAIIFTLALSLWRRRKEKFEIVPVCSFF